MDMTADGENLEALNGRLGHLRQALKEGRDASHYPT
jgi:hypothetical protein